jgi:thiol-disulfide isomerase/thioredoxin
MIAQRLLFIGATVFVLTLSSALRAAEGDAEWQKVTEAVDGLKTPKVKPTSREEAIAMLKTGLTAFDTAYAAARKVAPNHPTRWDAALFEIMVSRARAMAQVPAPEKNVVTFADSTAWLAKADQHLKAYPAEPMNRMVEDKVRTMKAAVALKTKPLELKFTAVDGKEFDLSKLQGKVVLIDFWATWCGPCVAELPNVLKAYKELNPKGFEIVGISLDQDKAALEAFVKEHGMAWPQYFDGKGWQNEISTQYGISSIPAMWLVNKKGMVVNTNARAGLEEQVAKLLAE